MRFEESYERWQTKQLTQEEAAQLLGISSRTFRRHVESYEEAGLEGLLDKRLNQVSHLRAPVDEVVRLEVLYRERYDSWNVKHFYSKYKGEYDGQRSYTWVKNHLQKAKLVKKGKHKGAHRKRRERAPLAGMMIHQDGSTHAWVTGHVWDLIITMDDATSEIYSGFFVDEEGTASSFRGVSDTLKKYGLFSSFYSDRGSHYWHTPVAGGKVDKVNLTQFGRALHQLGIQMIAAYSPQARGRSERMFKTLQERLPKELALHGITDMVTANRFLIDDFLPTFNAEFQVTAAESGSAFVPVLDARLKDILCVQEERTVGNDNCVRYQGLVLQLPKNHHRAHYMKAKVMVHHYPEGGYAIFHGPRLLAYYDETGALIETQSKHAVA
jgi:transposase